MSGKRALIRGTAILTITSFVTRFMGFFYRIFFKIIVYIKKIYIIARCLSQCKISCRTGSFVVFAEYRNTSVLIRLGKAFHITSVF